MRARCTVPRFLLALAALSSLALGPARSSAEVPAPAAGDVTFAPLFDATTRFTPGKVVQLRFRAQDRRTGRPVSPADLTVSLRRRSEPDVRLRARPGGHGTMELLFAPREPGRYELVVAVRGAPRDAIPPVRLGVVGLAAGLEEVPAGPLDAALERHARLRTKSTSAR